MIIRSANYATNGVLLLAKVILGRVYHVQGFAQVKDCPAGYDSVSPIGPGWCPFIQYVLQVVFNRQNGQLNETVVYRDDAIRPVFLIMFGS